MAIPDGLELTPFDPTFNDDPYAVYARLRDEDPVHKDSASFYGNSWTISEYALVDQLLRDRRLTVDPRAIGIRRDPRADNAVTLREPDMMGQDGDGHQRLRAVVQKAFTPTAVGRFEPQIRKIVTACLEGISGPEFDLVADYAKPIPTIVIAEFIGVDSSDHAQFKQWTEALLMQGYPMPTEQQWQHIVDADQALRDYISRVIETRRQAPADDFVSRLIAAEEQDERLTSSEIVDMCCLLIGAGNFTTTDLISNAIYHFLSTGDHPTDGADTIEECLRFDSPVLAARRFVTEDIEVDGHHFPKGAALNLLLAAANHDPVVFGHADEFKIQSERQAHLAFGRGVHHCLGAALAKLEASVALDAFFAAFPEAKLISSKRRKQMDFRGFSQMMVKVA